MVIMLLCDNLSGYDKGWKDCSSSKCHLTNLFDKTSGAFSCLTKCKMVYPMESRNILVGEGSRCTRHVRVHGNGIDRITIYGRYLCKEGCRMAVIK